MTDSDELIYKSLIAMLNSKDIHDYNLAKSYLDEWCNNPQKQAVMEAISKYYLSKDLYS